MKITKFVTFFLCLIISLILTSECRVKYFISEMNSNCYSFNFSDTATDDILPIVNELAKKYEVTVYTRIEKVSKQDDTEYRFYQTSDFDRGFKYTYNDKINSLLYGNITIEKYPLTYFSELKEDDYFRIKGKKQNINDFITELENYDELRNISAYYTDYSESCLITVYGLWLIVLIFLFFVSFYQVSVFRREKMIAICYGNSSAFIILKSILSDFLVNIPITAISVFLIKSMLSLVIDRNIIFFLTANILVSAIPYISYTKFNIKSISHENRMLSHLVKLSRIFKLIITAMLIFVTVSAANMSQELVKSYKSNLSLKKYIDYNIIDISTDDLSKVPQEYFEIADILAQSYANRLIMSDIYTNFYKKYDLTIINRSVSGDEYGTTNRIYCNCNAGEYIHNIFGKYINNAEKSDVYFFIPDNQPDSDGRQKGMETLLSNYNGRKNMTKSVIFYNSDIDFSYFDKSDDNIIGTVKNPYVIYDTTVPTAEYLNPDTTRLDVATFVMYCDEELKNYFNRNNINYDIFNLRETIEYRTEKSKSEIFSLLILIVLLMMLEIIMTYNIISFDYRLNMKEYCVKRALGCGTLGKYKLQFAYIIIIYIIAVFAVCTMLKSVNIPVIVCSGTLLMLLDILSVIYFIIRTENKKVLAVLKGGML